MARTPRHGPDTFARGYEAAHDEMHDVLAGWNEHLWGCMDCPSCETIRAFKKELVRQLRERMNEEQYAIFTRVMHSWRIDDVLPLVEGG